MTPLPWSAIDGGYEAFEAEYCKGALLAAVKQNRFADHLEALGPPGMARWDPFLGEVDLRGHTFRAEQIGSFDGHSWLWAWANTYLNIPDERTTIARALRDLGPALQTPSIASSDERLPYMIGALALAHTNVEGYYIANSSQVYAILSGQITTDQEPLAEVHRAIDSLSAEPSLRFTPATALPVAATALGIDMVGDDRHCVLRKGDEELPVDLLAAEMKRLTSAFLPQRIKLPDLLPLLGDSMNFDVTSNGALAQGEGWRMYLTANDRLRPVMRAANALPGRVEEARTKQTVVVVRTQSDATLKNGLAPTRSSFDPLGLTSLWAPAGSGLLPTAGTVVASPVLGVCEALHRIPGALVYDWWLRKFYS
ncbi:MAG: DUF6882 domain-containing protein [Myxococcota bacterium]